MSDSERESNTTLAEVTAMSATSMLRVGAGAALVMGLVLIGVAIGAKLAPHVATVEQRVVEPVRRATSGRSTYDEYAGVVADNCDAIVTIRVAGVADNSQPSSSSKRKSSLLEASKKLAPRAGFFVTADGYIATAAKDLPTDPLEAVLTDESVLPATLVAADPVAGIALLKVDGDGETGVQFADDLEGVGHTGVALSAAPRAGCVASKAFVSTDFLGQAPGPRAFIGLLATQSSPTIGTPFFDARGRVMGMFLDNAKLQRGQFRSLLPGITVADVVSQLLRDQTAPDYRFGFKADDIGPELASQLGADRGRGSVISLIASGSPADKAGLIAGDVIIAVNGSPVSSASEVARGEDAAGGQLKLLVQRGSESIPITLSLGAPDQ